MQYFLSLPCQNSLLKEIIIPTEVDTVPLLLAKLLNTKKNTMTGKYAMQSLTRFRRASDGEVIRGQKRGFYFVASAVVIFSADLKSFLSHSLNMHFPRPRSSIAFFEEKSNIFMLGYCSARDWE
jgi:hypothetical protein